MASKLGLDTLYWPQLVSTASSKEADDSGFARLKHYCLGLSEKIDRTPDSSSSQDTRVNLWSVLLPQGPFSLQIHICYKPLFRLHDEKYPIVCSLRGLDQSGWPNDGPRIADLLQGILAMHATGHVCASCRHGNSVRTLILPLSMAKSSSRAYTVQYSSKEIQRNEPYKVPHSCYLMQSLVNGIHSCKDEQWCIANFWKHV